MLQIDSVHVSYGSIRALQGVSLEVPPGRIVTLLGANGSGKTTTLRTISGLLAPFKGAVRFEGRPIQGWFPERIVRLGISHVPEGRQVFGEFTVFENLKIGAFLRRDLAGIRDDIDRVFTLFPRLRERTAQPAETLSGGEQQMLSIGRALMARPRLLLLDEPSLGLAPIVVDEIVRILRAINDGGTTLLLVEQNSEIALSISHYAYVLETGRVAFEGRSVELLDNDRIRRTYLG